MLHGADFCNATRPFDIAKPWGESIFKEFFHQGDQEKQLNLDVSYLCDRNTTNFAKESIGFINFVITPYF